MNVSELDAHRASVTTDYGEISYVDVGEGPPALFVHGVFMSAQLWRNLVGELQDLRRCVALDLPAHGHTRVSTEQDLSLPAQAEMIEGFCEALGLEAVDLVGNDTGGALCQIFAARHPERIRTLTLTNCDAHDNLPPENFKETVGMAERGELAPIMAEMARDLEMARSQGMALGYEQPERLGEDVVGAYLGRFATAEGGRELERLIGALDAADLLAAEPRLKQLIAPTLIVWGTGDPFFEASWAHWLRDTIPGAHEVVELDGAKLFFPDERAAEFAVVLREHLEAHPAEVASAATEEA